MSSGALNLLWHVQDDNAYDELKGGSGSDWFLANIVAGNPGETLDKLEGFKLGVDWKDDI